MKRTIFSGILSYKRIIKSRPDDQTTRPSDRQKKKKKVKKRPWRIADLVIPADHRVKLNESEKRDKLVQNTEKSPGN